GVTGAIIAVGADGLSRTASSLADGVLAPLHGTMVAFAPRRGDALVGEASAEGGQPVIAAAGRVEVTPEHQWSVVVAMHRDEVLAPVARLMLGMATVGGVLLALVALAGL